MKQQDETTSTRMAENARVCWIEHDEPWSMESELISQLDLPLNLDQNRYSPFHGRLTEARPKFGSGRGSWLSAHSSSG